MGVWDGPQDSLVSRGRVLECYLLAPLHVGGRAIVGCRLLERALAEALDRAEKARPFAAAAAAWWRPERNVNTHADRVVAMVEGGRGEGRRGREVSGCHACKEGLHSSLTTISRG